MTQTLSESSQTNRHSWLDRLWPVYCLVVVLAAVLYARFDPYQIDGDAVSYMDIADMIRAHQWPGIVNGYWHPLYPAALALGQVIFHPTRFTELHVYYIVNLIIFFLQMAAVVAFTNALVKLREARGNGFLLGKRELAYAGLAVLVISSQRELSIGKVRPDALLQALFLLAFAALLSHLATEKLHYAAIAGAVFGLAFLTKSFAFPATLISVALLVGFSWFWLRSAPARIAAATALMLGCFAIVAGPYIAALSGQYHRLDFGDSGGLNYAWYVAGTEKMHLQNGTPELYGTSEVHLLHPEKIILRSPLVTSYREHPVGTYPPWFDAPYWNDRIQPHINPRGQLRTFGRETVLTLRYLVNHPEGWLLLLVIIALGARPVLCRANGFWITSLALGIAMWCIYGMVNVEERYVTVAWMAILLTLFAALKPAALKPTENSTAAAAAPALIVLLAVLAVGESFRELAELRRQQSIRQIPAGWYNPEIFSAARAINQLGIGQGYGSSTAVTCAGTYTCLYDNYWARLAGVKVLSEIYLPEPHPFAPLTTTPNMDAAIEAARRDGSQLIIGYFDPHTMNSRSPITQGWVPLGGTDYYALPLH